MDTRIPITLMGVVIVGAVVAMALVGIRVAQAGETGGGCAGGICTLPAAATTERLSPQEKQAAEKLQKEGLGFISARELSERIAAGKAPIIVDVLDAKSYGETHVKGAINIPYVDVAKLAATALPDKKAEVVVYCGSYTCGASTASGKALKEMGYVNVRDYKGGIKEWTEKGLPVEGSTTTR